MKQKERYSAVMQPFIFLRKLKKQEHTFNPAEYQHKPSNVIKEHEVTKMPPYLILYMFLCKKQVHKKYEAQIMQKLRNS